MKVCTCCFNDVEIKEYITTKSIEKGKCDYCLNDFNSDLLDIGELLDFFAGFIDIFKLDEEGELVTELIKKDWNIFSNDTESNDILSDILLELSLDIIRFTEKVSYTDEIIECISYWDDLKENLKWKRRFLTDIEEIEDLGWNSFFNEQIILPIDTELYRARIHHKEDQTVFPQENMGCPLNKLTSSGRANPQGIPYLYLSKTPETTLYETRSSYLDELSIGKFKIKNEDGLVLVDFIDETSAFASSYTVEEHAKSVLLKRLISADLSKPIRRYDSELDYIPTQFICEFIRSVTNADGILFKSSLHIGGENIVLFEQDKVECISVDKYKIMSVQIDANII